MRKDFLHFSPPLIGKEEMAEVIDTLRSDWITTGPKVRPFEEEFAVFIGAPAALAFNSCTAALHVALAALGIGPGDAVITSPMTFCSSVHVIAHAGARPILVDVEPDTLNIDPQQVEAVVTQLLRRPKQSEVGRRRSVSPSTPPRTSPPPKEGCLPARLSSWTRPASGACTG
jgi:dTDP-4-amino-4,6-dideoxygalactose transaminase